MIKSLGSGASLPAPQVTVGAATASLIPLSWGAVDGALDYSVYVREVGAELWDEVATGVVGTSQSIADLDQNTEYEFRVDARLQRTTSTTGRATTEEAAGPFLQKLVMQAYADGWESKAASTRAIGSYLLSARNPQYGNSTVTATTAYLWNPTATPIPLGRCFATQTGGWSASINAISKRNIGADPATSNVQIQALNLDGSPATEIPAGTVNAPGIVKLVAPFGPGGTGGVGGVVFRYEIPFAGARMERYTGPSSGFIQAQSGYVASIADPSSTETHAWDTFAGGLIREVHFSTIEDFSNIAVPADSHVAGFVTGDDASSWTYLAQDRFREAGIRVNLVNYGRSGSTSPNWIARIQDRIDRIGFQYTAVLTKTWTVNEAGTEYTQAERDADIAEIAPLISYLQGKGVAPLFLDVVLPVANNYNTAQEVQYIRDCHAACGSRIFLDAYRAMLVDPDAAVPTVVSGFLRPDNLHLSAPTNSTTVAAARPDPQTTGVDKYAAVFAAGFPSFLDAQGVPR